MVLNAPELHEQPSLEPPGWDEPRAYKGLHCRVQKAFWRLVCIFAETVACVAALMCRR